MIPYGHQFIDDDDIAAVSAVLRGEWLTQGPAVDSFEEALAAKVGCRHAVVFSSGTAALHGAMYAAEGHSSGELQRLCRRYGAFYGYGKVRRGFGR